MQYEISNFARPGFESRHNLKYWHCEEYLGLGPAAHSFLNGKRFYETRDLRAFLAGQAPVEDADPEMPAGGPEEYAMLALRLAEGLQEARYRDRFGEPIPGAMETCGAAVCPRWPDGVLAGGFPVYPEGVFGFQRTFGGDFIRNVISEK